MVYRFGCKLKHYENNSQYNLLMTLLTLSIHQRDVCEHLNNQTITSVADFEWLKQMRYYWDYSSDELIVKMAMAE